MKIEHDAEGCSKVIKIEQDAQNFSNVFKIEHNVEDIHPEWQDSELLSQETCIEPKIAQSVIKLLDEGNTIPFIARYRKNMTNNMTPEELRVVKEEYDDIVILKSKLKNVAKVIEKTGQLSQDVWKSLISVRTIEELEHVVRF